MSTTSSFQPDHSFTPHGHLAWHHVAAGVSVAAAGSLSAFAALGLYIERRLTCATRCRPPLYGFSPFEVGVRWEAVAIPASDGSVLSSWWFDQPQSEAVIVASHGYRGHKAELLGIGAALWRAGYTVVLFDCRGHGDQVGSTVTLGYRELEDLLSAIRFARARRPEAAIGLIGLSMGASIAIMAGARDPTVRAVVADSPFAAQKNPVAWRIGRTLRAPAIVPAALAATDMVMRLRRGFGFSDVEPIREVAALAPRALLLIHGEDDAIIQPEDSHLLYRAAGEPKELWTLPGVGHCGAYFADRQHYVARVCDFFDRTCCVDGNVARSLTPLTTT
jgi:alpha-beta hydrolase superfamily lysophospholipase